MSRPFGYADVEEGVKSRWSRSRSRTAEEAGQSDRKEQLCLSTGELLTQDVSRIEFTGMKYVPMMTIARGHSRPTDRDKNTDFTDETIAIGPLRGCRTSLGLVHSVRTEPM